MQKLLTGEWLARHENGRGAGGFGCGIVGREVVRLCPLLWSGSGAGLFVARCLAGGNAE